MKKIILIVVLITFSMSSFAQQRNNEWLLNIGLNTVNHLGSRSPIFHPERWVTEFPISAAVEFNWGKELSIEQSITFNGFNEGDDIDGRILEKSFNYLSFDTHAKYYFGKHFLSRRTIDWLDFYANAGFGFFQIEDSNISANLGGGVLFWLNKDRSFGLRAQIIGKFAFNHKDSGIDNNHYQYHLQAVFKL